jgi:hypothetical protein
MTEDKEMGETMRFTVSKDSQGAISRDPPCRGAVRGPESSAWPGEYTWFLELNSLDDLISLLQEQGGALGLFAPEEGEDHPAIEIFDDEDEE